MTWYTPIRYRITQKLHGYRTRQQDIVLSAACRRIPKLIKKFKLAKADSIAIFETALTYLLRDVDKKSRDFIYKNSSVIMDSTDKADVMCLATDAMLAAFTNKKDSAQATLTVRDFAEKLIKDVNLLEFEHRDAIYKAIILRFAVELSHNDLTTLTNTLIPDLINKKQQNTDSHMYG